MNKNSQKTLVILVILIVALIGIWAASSHSGTGAASQSPEASSTSGTGGMNVSMASSSAVGPLIYGLATDKQSYTQEEQINIVLEVINETGKPKTFASPNGCQATFTIGTFNMLDHMQCLPGAVSFTVAPGSRQSVELAYYPSVGELPVGTTTLTANFVGAGGSSKQIVITP